MKMIKILFIFLCMSAFSNVHAQNTQDTQKSLNSEIHYKIIFQNVDQYQLKELVPICVDLFQSGARTNGGETNILYFDTAKEVTSEMLKNKLLENNYTYKFDLLMLNDNTNTYEKK